MTRAWISEMVSHKNSIFRPRFRLLVSGLEGVHFLGFISLFSIIEQAKFLSFARSSCQWARIIYRISCQCPCNRRAMIHLFLKSVNRIAEFL